MARSNVTLEEYLFETQHEIDQAEKSEKFPPQLLYQWSHKDICETTLRLGGIINQLYRETVSLPVKEAAGHYDATASHVAGAVVVSGFSFLVPDSFVGGSALAIVSGVFYPAQIVSNTATTITITNGLDLPAMTDEKIVLTSNNSKYYLDLSELLMINYAEPIWQVLDNSGNPVDDINIDEARDLLNNSMYNDAMFYYILGQTLPIVAGSNKTVTGNYTVGYYALPVEATALTDYIDFPQDWHSLAQAKTMIRVLTKLEKIDKARNRRIALEKKWADIQASLLNAATVNKNTGERR